MKPEDTYFFMSRSHSTDTSDSNSFSTTFDWVTLP